MAQFPRFQLKLSKTLILSPSLSKRETTRGTTPSLPLRRWRRSSWWRKKPWSPTSKLSRLSESRWLRKCSHQVINAASQFQCLRMWERGTNLMIRRAAARALARFWSWMAHQRRKWIFWRCSIQRHPKTIEAAEEEREVSLLRRWLKRSNRLNRKQPRLIERVQLWLTLTSQATSTNLGQGFETKL